MSPTSRLCKVNATIGVPNVQRAVDEAAQRRRLARIANSTGIARYISVNRMRNGSVVANCSGV